MTTTQESRSGPVARSRRLPDRPRVATQAGYARSSDAAARREHRVGMVRDTVRAHAGRDRKLRVAGHEPVGFEPGLSQAAIVRVQLAAPSAIGRLERRRFAYAGVMSPPPGHEG